MNNENPVADTRHGEETPEPAPGQLTEQEGRAQTGSSGGEPSDEDGIPLLEEVVQLGEIDFGRGGNTGHRERRIPSAGAAGSSEPRGEFERDLLVYRLRTGFADDLEEIIHGAVSAAVERSMRDLETTLRRELMESWETRLAAFLASLADGHSSRT